jgi:hypothetical protein
MTVVYDRTHEAVRRAMLAAASPTTPCWRCGRPLGPDPSRIDLGHRDDGPGWAGLVSGLPAGGPFRAENGAGCPLTSLLYGR